MRGRYAQDTLFMQTKISKDKYIFFKKKSILKELGRHYVMEGVLIRYRNVNSSTEQGKPRCSDPRPRLTKP